MNTYEAAVQARYEEAQATALNAHKVAVSAIRTRLLPLVDKIQGSLEPDEELATALAEIMLEALTSDTKVRAGFYEAAERACIAAGVAKETERPFSHVVTDAILTALRPPEASQ